MSPTASPEIEMLLAEAMELRARARRARAVASEVRDDFIRSLLEKAADDFEKQAETLEGRARPH